MKARIINIKKAIGDYQKANIGEFYSPYYGYLMLDKSTGELWTDEFYSFGHNSWIEYHSKDIINLGKMMQENGIENITMKTVREFIKLHDLLNVINIA